MAKKQMVYGANDTPRFPIMVLAGAQHVLTLFGATTLVPLILGGELQPGHTGREGLELARERHIRVVAELPPAALSLTRGEPVIVTEYR